MWEGAGDGAVKCTRDRSDIVQKYRISGTNLVKI